MPHAPSSSLDSDGGAISSATTTGSRGTPSPASSSSDIARALHGGKARPVNIVMLVVGTRGDVQPFVGIALKLKEYGHRVRIATHKVFREFVTGFGIEFYPLGGDPKILSENMVRHRGIGFGISIKDALDQVRTVEAILNSSYDACVLPDPENPVPFIADAIVANPVAYGHTHCAEKLNVPLHIVFTMPWTPTTQFPSPLARMRTNDIDGEQGRVRSLMNKMSYFAVDLLTWMGMSRMVRRFRSTRLGLPKEQWNRKENGAHTIYHSQVPVTYIWSPSLVDRPSDWPEHCQVVGFVNMELNKLSNFQPPEEWQRFLDAGPPPVYIGFGSLVVDNPERLVRRFIKALRATGQRAIIQKGWGGLGDGFQGEAAAAGDVLFIGPAPHDWLFSRCSAVIHHGGAGTTATGLYCGKPTFIVPFFGDQSFWGAACHKAGVGPAPVPIDKLTTKKIKSALETLATPSCLAAAKAMQERLLKEDGIAGTVDHIHRTIYGALLDGVVYKWMKRGANDGALSWMQNSSSVLTEGTNDWTTASTLDGSDCDGVLEGHEVLREEAVEEEVFENERFQPLNWSWGSRWPGHLLPTDPVARWSVASTATGSSSGPGGAPPSTCSTSMRMEDVAPGLPCADWRWADAGWRPDLHGHGERSVDSEGWFYALDFRYLKRQPGAGEQRAHHFVRRRRWVRTRAITLPAAAAPPSPAPCVTVTITVASAAAAPALAPDLQQARGSAAKRKAVPASQPAAVPAVKAAAPGFGAASGLRAAPTCKSLAAPQPQAVLAMESPFATCQAARCVPTAAAMLGP